MDAVLDVQNYHFHLMSLPFAIAALVLAGMLVYVYLLKLSTLLRGSFLIVCGGLIPLMVSHLLVGSIDNSAIYAPIYKICLATTPVSASAVVVFLVVLHEKFAQYWLLVFMALISGVVQGIVLITTDLYIDGVWQTSLGFYHYRAGPLAPVFIGHAAVWGVVAMVLGYHWTRTEQPPLRRRQIRSFLLLSVAFVVSVPDLLLAYGIGHYPLSWFSCSFGAGVLLRTILLDEQIHVQAPQQRAATALLYVVTATVGVWAAWIAAGSLATAIAVSAVLFVYIAQRLAFALIPLMQSYAVPQADTLLKSSLARYAAQVHNLVTESEIGELTKETVKVGLGCNRIDFLLLSASDWSWRTVQGEVLSERATPDPMTVNWFLDYCSHAIQREDLQASWLGDMRESIESLFDAHQAEVLVPLSHGDDMVGMIVISELQRGHTLEDEEQQFLQDIQERAAAALMYARVHREANARVAQLHEMELAAAVQSAFVPEGDLIDYGAVQISGLWAPASRCGGDWWWVHHLPDGRVLVLIGDVTGHGVAAAMVTAAAKGCYDVAQRIMGTDLDLVRLLELLDHSVRLMGGGSFHMTCFATLLDPATGTVSYANAGHVVPYVCRPLANGGTRLGVLAARGTPLGTGTDTDYESNTRELQTGDIVVWYTDGIVECIDREQQQYGDRRFQRLLRKIHTLKTDARGIRDHIARAVVAFQQGQPPDDDITLVVARVDAVD